MISLSQIEGKQKICFNNVNRQSLTYIPVEMQFYPSTNRQIINVSHYYLKLTNILTGVEYICGVNNIGSTNRFINGEINLAQARVNGAITPIELGSYKYQLIEDVDSVRRVPLQVLASGLLRLINNETFTDKYITPKKDSIPSSIVYKPS